MGHSISRKSHALSSSCNIDHFVVQLFLRLRHSSSPRRPLTCPTPPKLDHGLCHVTTRLEMRTILTILKNGWCTSNYDLRFKFCFCKNNKRIIIIIGFVHRFCLVLIPWASARPRDAYRQMSSGRARGPHQGFELNSEQPPPPYANSFVIGPAVIKHTGGSCKPMSLLDKRKR